MMLVASFAQMVGQTATDRLVIAMTWVGLIALAAIILIGSSTTPHARR
jgi:hypothetical protein